MAEACRKVVRGPCADSCRIMAPYKLLLLLGCVSCTSTLSRGIMHQQPAMNNKLAPKPTPKPKHNPTLTLTLTLNWASNSKERGKPIARLLIASTSTPFWIATYLQTRRPVACRLPSPAAQCRAMPANHSDCWCTIPHDRVPVAGAR